MEVFIGTIQPFAFEFAPRGWAQCKGQQLSQSQYTALFGLIGTAYGPADPGKFCLPDLQGRLPMGQGNGVGLTPRDLGQKDGAEKVALTVNNMPPHTHSLNAYAAAGTQANPTQDVMLATARGYDDESGDAVNVEVYAPAGSSLSLKSTSIGVAGAGQPFVATPPLAVVNYSIALEGLMPTKG